MNDKSNVRVIIADDHEKVRLSLKLLFEQETAIIVVGEATESVDLILELQKIEADILLLDWELPGLPACQLLRLIRIEQPLLAIVAMSSRPEARDEARAEGVSAFLDKGASPDAVLSVMRAHTEYS